MTKLEQLKLEYARLKKDVEFFLKQERVNHEFAEESEKKMKTVEKEIKEIEDDKRLFECVDYIMKYCRRKNYCCDECKFYTEIGEFNKTNCMLRNNFPEYWTNLKR